MEIIYVKKDILELYAKYVIYIILKGTALMEVRV